MSKMQELGASFIVQSVLCSVVLAVFPRGLEWNVVFSLVVTVVIGIVLLAVDHYRKANATKEDQR